MTTTFGPTAGVSLRCIPERRVALPEWVRTQDDLRRAMQGEGPDGPASPKKGKEAPAKATPQPKTNQKIGPLILRFLVDYGAATNVDIAEEIGASMSGVNRRLRRLERAGHVEILQGRVRRGRAAPAIWAATEEGAAYIDRCVEPGRWVPSSTSIAGRMLEFMRANKEATVLQAGEGLDYPPRRVGKIATDLCRAGYIKRLRKEGQYIVWGLV